MEPMHDVGHPTTWLQCNAKLKQLFPAAKERGSIRGLMLLLPEARRLEYFDDTDENVRGTLVAAADLAGTSGDNPRYESVHTRVEAIIDEALGESFSPTGTPKWNVPIMYKAPSKSFQDPVQSGLVASNAKTPSLLSESSLENEDRPLSTAQKWRTFTEEVRKSKGHQASTTGRVTMAIAPSGSGKTCTAYKGSCSHFAFYLSFIPEKEAGSSVLHEAIKDLETRYEGESAAAGRERRFCDADQLVTRIVLALALGLRRYYQKFPNVAHPEGFLRFQLIGANNLTDFFDIFVDGADLGVQTLEDYFPDNNYNRGGLSVFQAWLRVLPCQVFNRFHFNFRHQHQLEGGEAVLGRVGRREVWREAANF